MIDFIGIIPARSGSKGLPDKNIRLLGGQPLLAYSIAVAKLAGSKRVLVSTDSEEYAEIAGVYGAEVPFIRPKELSDDKSTDYEFMHHAMTWITQKEEKLVEYWVHLRPTTPLRTPNILREAMECIQQHSQRCTCQMVMLISSARHGFWQNLICMETRCLFLSLLFVLKSIP